MRLLRRRLLELQCQRAHLLEPHLRVRGVHFRDELLRGNGEYHLRDRRGRLHQLHPRRQLRQLLLLHGVRLGR